VFILVGVIYFVYQGFVKPSVKQSRKF
jgi:hypothetical protein